MCGVPAALQRRIQVLLVDDPATRAVDDAHAVLHRRDRRRVDEILRLRRQRRVNRDHVGAAEELGQAHDLDAHLAGPFLRQIWIVRDHVHHDTLGQLGKMAPDLSHPDNAESLVVEFHAHEFLFFPLAGLHRGGGLRNLAGEGKDHREGVLGRGHGVAARRVHHHDAALGGRRSVHVVQAGPCPSDDPELVGGGDDLGRHFRPAPNDQPFVVLDLTEQFVLGHLGLDVHGQTGLLEDLHPLLGEVVADKDFHFASSSSSAFPTPDPSFTG